VGVDVDDRRSRWGALLRVSVAATPTRSKRRVSDCDSSAGADLHASGEQDSVRSDVPDERCSTSTSSWWAATETGGVRVVVCGVLPGTRNSQIWPHCAKGASLFCQRAELSVDRVRLATASARRCNQFCFTGPRRSRAVELASIGDDLAASSSTAVDIGPGHRHYRPRGLLSSAPAELSQSLTRLFERVSVGLQACWRASRRLLRR
jgi:hypothetical protein